MKVEINIEALLEKKMRLNEGEKLVNLNYQPLWDIKAGRTSKVTFETIGELLKAFQCKPNDLFEITK